MVQVALVQGVGVLAQVLGLVMVEVEVPGPVGLVEHYSIRVRNESCQVSAE